MMHPTPSRRRLLTGATAALSLGLLLAACSTDASPNDDGAGTDRDADPTELTIGLTYIPDVQFAPFYLAADEADSDVLDITLRHHGASESLFGALESGDEDVVVAGNAEILQAASAGVDVLSIATVYQSYPVQIFVPADSDIETVADLQGRSVGVPGPFGETWFGLLGYLDEAGLSQDDVSLEHVGFTLFNALSEGHVDAVAGFVTSDATNFANGGFEVRQIADADALPLISIGIGASSQWLDDNPGAAADLNALVATELGRISDDPQLAVDATSGHIPGTWSEEDRTGALMTAQAMAQLYGSPPFGAQNEADWEAMAQFMEQMDLLEGPIEASEAYTAAYLEQD